MRRQRRCTFVTGTKHPHSRGKGIGPVFVQIPPTKRTTKRNRPLVIKTAQEVAAECVAAEARLARERIAAKLKADNLLRGVVNTARKAAARKLAEMRIRNGANMVDVEYLLENEVIDVGFHIRRFLKDNELDTKLRLSPTDARKLKQYLLDAFSVAAIEQLQLKAGRDIMSARKREKLQSELDHAKASK